MSEILSAVERMLHDRRHIRADAEFEALRAERDEYKAAAIYEGEHHQSRLMEALELGVRARIAEERVRVLTEALANIIREHDAVSANGEPEDWRRYAQAMAAARSVLAAVPSEETTP
jgi:hypothetical protein